MVSREQPLIERFRQPEYTGDNRCIPCTTINLIIAVIVSVALGTVSLGMGIAVAAVSITIIYLRGYLVPGTPPLTKRYFPDRVLRLFDKTPVSDIDPCADVEAQLHMLGG